MFRRWIGHLVALLASSALCIAIVIAGSWCWLWIKSENEIEDLRIRAEAGDSDSQLALGRSYENGSHFGIGPAQDVALAVDWYSKAAEAGNGKAHLSLGLLRLQGERVDADHARAIDHFRFAADRGEPDAGYWLSTMYREGLGVPADERAALRLLREAAELGSTLAMWNLSFAYELGTFGLAPDPQAALEWSNRAKSRQRRDAEMLLNELSGRLFRASPASRR